MTLFPLLARFNRWANGRLYEACAGLTDGERKRDRKAFFRSIHNTLNHLLVVDRLWIGRIEGTDPGIRRLDEVLYDDFAALRAARRAEDARIVAFIDGLDPSRLAETVAYRVVSGAARETPLEVILITLFNHQTHHRGQVHNMLSQAGVETPALDIINFAPTGQYR